MKKISPRSYRPAPLPIAPPQPVSREQLLATYNPPFRLCFMGMYIHDNKGETVADFFADPRTMTGFRVRGYGMMKNRFRHPEAVFDAMEVFLLDLVKDCPTDKEQCVQKLNEAWGYST